MALPRDYAGQRCSLSGTVGERWTLRGGQHRGRRVPDRHEDRHLAGHRLAGSPYFIELLATHRDFAAAARTRLTGAAALAAVAFVVALPGLTLGMRRSVPSVAAAAEEVEGAHRSRWATSCGPGHSRHRRQRAGALLPVRVTGLACHPSKTAAPAGHRKGAMVLARGRCHAVALRRRASIATAASSASTTPVNQVIASAGLV